MDVAIIAAKEARPAAFALAHRFIALTGTGAARALPGGAEPWSAAMGELKPAEGLVWRLDFDVDWTRWEMHPLADEVLILASGAATLVWEADGLERQTVLAAGDAFIVPKGAWHRVLTDQACTLIGITYGDDTQHRPA